MKALSRTLAQVDGSEHRLYQKATPMWYKKPDGTFDDIDLTFNDATSSIGDISLMDKGIVSVGKRKGNNPHKIVGIRPDGNQHLGTQQLESTLVSVELDGELQDFNVESDLEVRLTRAKVYQLVKLHKPFNTCKIEFDIYAKNLELLNNKYTEATNICEYGFNLTNIGENNGNTTLALHNDYSRLNKDIPYFDCFAGKITDNYITTGGYSKEEEFGDSDLSNYVINEDMYPNGSSMYLKDCIIFTVQSYNIDEDGDVIVNNLCDMYGLEIFNDEGTGDYLTKNGKKVIGYFTYNNVFFGFINTVDIPNEIKKLFKEKSFEDTSFLNISLEQFCSDITSRLNKSFTIELDNTYYKPNGNSFDFKISNENMYILEPIAFDKDYNKLNYSTTHTLTDNENGSYRYTKYLKPESSLKLNNAQYLDVNLSISSPEDDRMVAQLSQKNSTNFTTIRNAVSGISVVQSGASGTAVDESGVTFMHYQAGDTFVVVSGKFAINRWNNIQTHYHFDSSSITGTMSDLAWKSYGAYYTYGTSNPYNDISVISLKSESTGLAGGGDGYPQVANFNEFTGHTSGWDSDDVTEYSGEVVIDGVEALGTMADNSGSRVLETHTFNTDARQDLRDNDSFKFVIIEYDQYYLNSLDTSYANNATGGRVYLAPQVDTTTSDAIPYLQFTYGDDDDEDGSSTTITYNAAFFGTNF